MATFPHYQQDILDNPIQRAEQSHLRRVRMSYFWRGVYVVTIFAMLAPILWGGSMYFQQTLEAVLVILLMLNVVCIFVVEAGIINQAADSIRREFQGKTWDLLILTGVNTWRLVLGKWLGTIRGNRRDIVFLYVLRMITVFWGMSLYYLQKDGFHYYYNYRSAPDYAYLSNIRIDFEGFVLIGLILGVYLLVEIMLVASLPLVFSLFKFSSKSAGWISVGLRIGIPIAIGLFLHAWHYDFPYRFGGVQWWSISYTPEHRQAIIGVGTALGDSGYGLSLLVAGRASIDNVYSGYILTQIAGLGVYLLWTAFMLRMAVFAARYANVSLPGYVPKSKPKRLIKAGTPTDGTATTPAVAQPKPRNPRESNLAGIRNPALYRCEVAQYDRETSQLAVAIYRLTETSADMMMHFSGVSYFTGAMSWTNAKFEELSDSQLQKFCTAQKLDYDKLPLDSTLYAVQSQGNRVRIIATGAEVQALNPSLFTLP